MPSYAVLTTTLGGPIGPRGGESFALPPVAPGPLTVRAFAVVEETPPRPRPRPRPRPGDDYVEPEPVVREIELDVEIVRGATVVATGHGSMTYAVPELASNYSVRVKNGSARERECVIEVRYTSQRSILSRRLPLAFFRRKFDEFVNDRRDPLVQLRVHGHELRVTIARDLAELHGIPPLVKDLGHLEADLPGPFNPDISIHDLNSNSIEIDAIIVNRPGSSSLETAAITVELGFETDGVEIRLNNFGDVDLQKLELRVQFALVRTSFGGTGMVGVRPTVTADVKATLNNGPNGIARQKVKETLESKGTEALLAIDLQHTMSKVLTRWLIGGLWDVRDVGLDGTDIVITYVEPAVGTLVDPFPETPQPPLVPGNLSKIEHIVVVMMENRSFDHMLGHLRLAGRADIDGYRGDERNVYKSRVYTPAPLASTTFEHSPCHDFDCVLNQVQGDMGGFVADFAHRYESRGADLGSVMGYHTGAQLPVYSLLAEEFAVCNRWFSAHPGPTWPNRFYTVTGRLNRDSFGRFEYDNPDLDLFAPVLAKTIFDHLKSRGVSWRYYEHGYCFLRLFHNFLGDVENVLPATRFFEDVAAGTLPSVAFLDPDYIDVPPGNDDHPPADVRNGQRFVGRVVDALMRGPKWDKTLFLLTYDEHGGFYDHVKPPAAVDVCGVDEYGPRVPGFVISPWVERRRAFDNVLDHTSILKTIVRRFCAANPPDLGARVREANDVEPLLSLAAPRTDRPSIPIPEAVAAREPVALRRIAPGSRDFHDLLRVARERYPVRRPQRVISTVLDPLGGGGGLIGRTR
ncbi:alkaline phosphatase family protein [Sandaracinus amylolyticus]|uniref:alkaline phosphatase family protein n=1 Tax=Sandaracinus amylolyticus TaxID=927083 RepID=UPI001F4182C9|nr:alkaline phosphatase family protein [Sandaracinus amylolyticus]UJR85562.1 Hypothetical protein I5071_76420 [Sandaracinus amylolyticus]